MNTNEILTNSANLIAQVGLKIVAAIILWFVGRKLINLAVNITSTNLASRRVDLTIINYLGSTISVVLNVILIVALLGFFGVETTSFAALLAAAGIAVGAAWSGLLANFAAGAFLVVFRPFKVGDFIAVAGLSGTVREIGIFVTTLNTLDNVQTIIGNNKILSDNIQNFTTNPYRRVDLTTTINHGVRYNQAVAVLQERLVNVPNVLPSPAPDIEILEFSLAGTVLAVRPYCKPEFYWQVYFDCNRVISESFNDLGFPAPEQHYIIRQGMNLG